MRKYKEILKLSKLAEKMQRLTKKQQVIQGKIYNRDYLAGAYYLYDDTYIVNDFWLVIFKNKIENLLMKPQTEYTFKAEQCVPCYNERKKVEIKDIKNFIEQLEEKSKNKERDDKIIKIGTSYYNAEYVLNVIKCFDKFEIWQDIYNNGKNNSLIITHITNNGEEDVGVVCPVRNDWVEKYVKGGNENE